MKQINISFILYLLSYIYYAFLCIHCVLRKSFHTASIVSSYLLSTTHPLNPPVLTANIRRELSLHNEFLNFTEFHLLLSAFVTSLNVMNDMPTNQVVTVDYRCRTANQKTPLNDGLLAC